MSKWKAKEFLPLKWAPNKDGHENDSRKEHNQTDLQVYSTQGAIYLSQFYCIQNMPYDSVETQQTFELQLETHIRSFCHLYNSGIIVNRRHCLSRWGSFNLQILK